MTRLEFLGRITFRPKWHKIKYDFLLFMLSAVGAQTAPKLDLYQAFKMAMFAFTFLLIWDSIRGIKTWKKKSDLS